MIQTIGVICQDANSLGLLRGLQSRLSCGAEFIASPTPIGKSRQMNRKQARDAWFFFRQRGAHLIVRFTDADRHRWQDVRRAELAIFPQEARSLVICGVAVENAEDWLNLDADYLADKLQIAVDDLTDSVHRTGRIKNAIARRKHEDERTSDVVAALVRDAPSDVFHRWLATDDALRTFYSDCRSAAASADCPTPNELDAPEYG